MVQSEVALLVIDMQNDIVRKYTHDDYMRKTIDVIKDMVQWAKERKVPVVYVRVCFRQSHVDAAASSPDRERHYLEETEHGSQIIDELRPASDALVVVKRRTGAFYGTDLEIVLRGLGAKTLLFTGTSTARAVESTVREAHSRDFKCIVLSDGCYARTREMHQNSLNAMADWFSQVMTADETKAKFSLGKKEATK
jgi:nicotinamidase-related amidase